MKIAVITITYNDGYKLDKWQQFYNHYRNGVDYHIIVDNGSTKEYLECVKEFFKNSIIIENGSNLGLTKAYNIGIKYALEKTDADSIMLMANDIDINSNSLLVLNKFLEDGKADAVAPIMLNNDGITVADFGCEIDKHLMLKPFMCGMKEADIADEVHYCEALTGGCNIATRHFYEKVGLQDELLFMYSDEVDTGIRAKKEGMRLASLSSSKCWHKHTNPNNSKNRLPFSSYLMARNKIYLAKKHNLKHKRLNIAFTFLKQSLKCFFVGFFRNDKELKLKSRYILAGIIHGMKNDMKSNKYTQTTF